MKPATAFLIKSLVRQAKGALAAVEKWVDEVQDFTPPKEIESNHAHITTKQ
jgi:hypothetical protein